MTVRFDDSLPLLLRTIADELGSDILSSGVVLRDTTGRLAFFTPKKLKQEIIERLSNRLRSILGPYARSDRVIAVGNEFGVQEILGDQTALPIAVDTFNTCLIDRRLVGADWLRTPAPAAPPPPRFVFASLKGGVGRSTALSVAAAHFAAQGRRILAIDLDMEAPGLGAMLLDDGTLPEFGLIDALVENGLAPLDASFFADLVGPSALADRRGRIDVIPAFGRRSLQNPGDVLAKIARAYAEDIESNGTISTILDQISSLVEHFSVSPGYDCILVDSRAGLHETAASAILGLGAEVYLFGLNERQTFQGYSALLAHLARFVRFDDPSPEWLERVTMVQGRAPAPLEDRTIFAEKCNRLFSDVGLLPGASGGSDIVSLPAIPFKDVPWDDDDNVNDDDLRLDEPSGPGEPFAILEDERFRLFEPLRRNDLLSEHVYYSSFGAMLERMSEAFDHPKSGAD